MKKISMMLILALVLGGCTTPHEMAFNAGKKVVKKTMSKDDSSSDDTQSDSKE